MFRIADGPIADYGEDFIKYKWLFYVLINKLTYVVYF
jgi:hypothetical protein